MASQKGHGPRSLLRSWWRGLLAFLGSFSGEKRPSAVGSWGEEVAAAYLGERGYGLLERNYRIRGGEADLILKLGESVVVVEVKTRQGGNAGAAITAVTPEKARRVWRAARAYCRRRGISLARLRVDVVTVEGGPDKGRPVVRHFPGLPPPRGRA